MRPEVPIELNEKVLNEFILLEVDEGVSQVALVLHKYIKIGQLQRLHYCLSAGRRNPIYLDGSNR